MLFIKTNLALVNPSLFSILKPIPGRDTIIYKYNNQIEEINFGTYDKALKAYGFIEKLLSEHNQGILDLTKEYIASKSLSDKFDTQDYEAIFGKK